MVTNLAVADEGVIDRKMPLPQTHAPSGTFQVPATTAVSDETIVARLDDMLIRRCLTEDETQHNLDQVQDGAFVLVIEDLDAVDAAIEAAFAAIVAFDGPHSDRRVLLIDYRWEGNGLSRAVEADQRLGLRHILAGAMLHDAAFLHTDFFDFLPLGPATVSAPSADERRAFANFLTFCRSAYDITIILTQKLADEPAAVDIARAGDGALVAAYTGATRFENLKKIKTLLWYHQIDIGGVLLLKKETALHRLIKKLGLG